MICCYQLLYSLCWLLKHQLPSQEKSIHRIHAVSFAPDSVSISHAAREPVILTPWLCPRMSVTPILTARPILFLLPILTAPSPGAPTPSSFAQTAHQSQASQMAPLPTLIRPKFLSILAASGRESQTWRLKKCHPSSHARRTYACPCVRTQWIFSFNEAICPVNLAPFPLLYTGGHST